MKKPTGIKTAALAMIVLTLAVLLFIPIAAESQNRIDDSRFIPVASLRVNDLAREPELRTAFEGWRKAVEGGSMAEVSAMSGRIKGIMARLGTKNLFSLSDMAIAVGHGELAKKADDMAITAGLDAVNFAPDHPEAYLYLMSAYFAKNKFDIKNTVTNLALAAVAVYSDNMRWDMIVASAVRYILATVMLAFVIVFLVLLGVSFKALSADIASAFPSIIDNRIRMAVGVMVIMAPLAVGGPLLFMLLAPVFLWPYIRTYGRGVIVLFVLFVFAIPSMFDFMAKGVVISGADTYRAIYLLSRDTWDYETRATLEKEHAEHPNDATVSFALGLLNRYRKDKDGAIRAYDAALELNHSDLRVIVNKGNTYFVARDYENAINMYKEAIRINPKSLEAHFNLSNTYVYALKTKEADAEYKIAQTIDSAQAARFVDQARQDEDKKVVDFPINRDDLSAYGRKLNQGASEISETIWNAYIGFVSRGAYTGIMAALMFLLALSHVFWMKNLAHQPCSTCGLPFRSTMRLGVDAPKCNQCVASQIGKTSVSTAAKDKKKKEIREFRERRDRAAALLDRIIPGAGRVYFQFYFSGFVYTLITSAIIVYGVSAIATDIFIYNTPAVDILLRHVVYLVIVTTYWAAMNTALKKDFY